MLLGSKRYHLNLVFSWEPVFTSGPNTYKDPVKESALGAGPWFSSESGLDGFNWLMDLLIPQLSSCGGYHMTTRPEAGRFGLKLEGAGKVRTFAIPNPIFQRLLKPLHDWRSTDMFPSVLTGSMLSGIFGDDLGRTWYLMMNQVAFRSPEKTGSPVRARVSRFTRGQPLGYLSSWPSFTLTHHMVVWLAAYLKRS
ncbi:UNVERIFIED_CONTAM: hypothetical protein Slati_4553300 [Sesamum latifolium]|uniref:Uncharacterized protein n=1 Tax=Sesamum latifolium TaxID=2727402 RepID=A0AAW2S282_9LAMI